MKYFKKNMIREIGTSFTYQIIEEIVTRITRTNIHTREQIESNSYFQQFQRNLENVETADSSLALEEEEQKTI
jgi:ABC-type siderophore export system fused ATPase/permease subunit